MSAFLAWANDAADKTDAVLRAASAHLWFVTIHPFDDGNGRIARAITDWALARSEGSPQRFYSMSAQLRQERNDYYARPTSDREWTPNAGVNREAGSLGAGKPWKTVSRLARSTSSSG